MRRRILLLVVGMTTLVVLAFAIPIAFLVRGAAAQQADNATRDDARTLALSLRYASLTDAQIESYVRDRAAAWDRQVAVTLPDGRTVGGAPADAAGSPGSGGAPAGDGGAPHGDGGDEPGVQVDIRPVAGGQLATSVAVGGDGPITVRVFVADEERYEGANAWYWLLAAGAVGLLLVSVLAGELLTRRIARPLLRTAQTARRLSVGDTLARAPTEGPREVAEVGVALNRLADRIDELIAEERETVADLSHRLRTPLTTLRLDAEALRDPAEADRVAGHVDDLERTLTAVIRAARRPQREGRMPASDATAVVGERVEFWSPLTDEQGRSCTVALPGRPLPVRAAAEDLAAAIDALIENVIAHTPEGAPFSVRLSATAAGARLEVEDEGPGIPAEAEVRGRSDRGRTGLGLDIARRCAAASGGSMTIARGPSGGALVTLLLGPP